MDNQKIRNVGNPNYIPSDPFDSGGKYYVPYTAAQQEMCKKPGSSWHCVSPGVYMHSREYYDGID